MKALILKGKRKGEVVEVSQWCNDWFMVDGNPSIYSPTSLAFSKEDAQEIKNHKNNGMLFYWYTLEFNHDLKLWVFKKLP